VARCSSAGVGQLKLEHERFKDFAEHFGVNGDLDAEGAVLADGEIVRLQEVGKDVLENVVADFQGIAPPGGFAALLGAVFVREQAAVEKRQVVTGDVGFAAFGGQLDEKRFKELLVKRGAVWASISVFSEIAEEVVGSGMKSRPRRW
jgi:hypothetical protein